MNRIFQVLSDPANTAELWLLITCALLLAALGIAWLVRRVDRTRPRYTVTRIEPRCERAGSQGEFYRRMRARGAR